MARLAYLAAALSLAAPAFASCNYGTHLYPRSETVPISNFSYTGLTGPLNWYGLNKTANRLCAVGQNQSPINLDAKVVTRPGTSISLTVQDDPLGGELENLGTTVEVPTNGSLKADGKTYSLAQFHFHTPSEHRLNSEYFPGEVHFVFSAPDRSTAVVAFFISLGTVDPLLASVFESIEDIATPGNVTGTGPLHFAALENLLKTHNIYTYSGSLTTPPCSEGVTWYISQQPLLIDQTTYGRVKSVVKFNSRYTQNTPGGINLLQNIANELYL